MEQVIKVGMAEIKIARSPAKLIASGLGSCVAICAYDSIVKVGGIAHIMLPLSSMINENKNIHRGKFADTAVPFLLEEMEKMGAVRNRLAIKLVGGAEMFAHEIKNERLKIGERNLQEIETVCRDLGLKISGRCVGGNTGRSVTMDLESGEVQVKTINGTITLP